MSRATSSRGRILRANSRTSDSPSSDGGATRSQSVANSQEDDDFHPQRGYGELTLAPPCAQMPVPEKAQSFRKLMVEEQTWHLNMQAYWQIQSTIERITKPSRSERRAAPSPELLLCVIGAGTSSPIQVPLTLLNGHVHYHMI
jgi:hypothetical protein